AGVHLPAGPAGVRLRACAGGRAAHPPLGRAHPGRDRRQPARPVGPDARRTEARGHRRMTPPATATQPHPARPARRRPQAKRPPRGVAGPSGSGGRPGTPAVGGPRGWVAVAPPLALRLARTAARIGDARFLDRLLRGRAWIAVIALALMGIVFIQVSMLSLNS